MTSGVIDSTLVLGEPWCHHIDKEDAMRIGRTITVIEAEPLAHHERNVRTERVAAVVPDPRVVDHRPGVETEPAICAPPLEVTS